MNVFLCIHSVSSPSVIPYPQESITEISRKACHWKKYFFHINLQCVSFRLRKINFEFYIQFLYHTYFIDCIYQMIGELWNVNMSQLLILKSFSI